MKIIKVILLSVTLCVAAVSAEAAPEKSTITNNMENKDYDINQALSDFVQGKGVKLWYKFVELMEEMKKDCPTFEKDFEKEFSSVRECAERLKLNTNQTICQTVQTHFHICNKPIRDLLSNCLPPKSKDLPQLISKIVVAVFDEACHTTVEQILEMMNPCQFKTEFTDYESCKAVKTEVDNFTDKFPTKKFVCSLIPKVKDCSHDRHAASCSNPVTKKAFVNIHEAVEEATKEMCANPSKNEIS